VVSISIDWGCLDVRAAVSGSVKKEMDTRGV